MHGIVGRGVIARLVTSRQAAIGVPADFGAKEWRIFRRTSEVISSANASDVFRVGEVNVDSACVVTDVGADDGTSGRVGMAWVLVPEGENGSAEISSEGRI